VAENQCDGIAEMIEGEAFEHTQEKKSDPIRSRVVLIYPFN
jgi:hypothetical protein